jgi:hypothetical protein
MPSPLGRVPFRVEGQTDMPINYLHLGEVQTDTPINRLYLGEVHPTQDRLSFDPQPPRQRTR